MKSVNAHYIVQKAITDGLLQRKPCEICGNPRTHGHHDDYFMPLAVRWLCSTHHTQWHKENPSPPNPPYGKKPKNMRFTPETIETLKEASRREGVSETVYVEKALRNQFRKDGY